mgnify:CR=1 FL=1
MFKLLYILPVILLAACAPPTPQIIISKELVSIPFDNAMFTCPYVPSSELPNPETMTKSEFAEVLAETRFNNKICHNNMEVVKKAIQDANSIVSKKD